MEAAFYYIVRVNLIRFIEDDNIDFIRDEIEFKEENPIVARVKALDYYNSYVDALLEPNLSHNEVKHRLSERIKGADKPNDPDCWTSVEDIYIPPSIFNGIGVFQKIQKPIDDDIEGTEHLIHGVGYSSDSLEIMDGLNFELNYFNHYGYDKDDKEISVRFYNYDDDEVYDEVILKTPYDWKGLDVRTFEGEEEEKEEESSTVLQNKELVDILLDKGESQIIEFKSSLVAFKNEAGLVGYSRYVKFNIIKAIASFLNSKGGFLLIGVGDNGDILGLENDFSLAGNKSHKPKDYFNLEIDRIIKENFKPISSKINGYFVELGEEWIYVLKIEPSSQPVFVMNRTDKILDNHKKEFYVRTTGASSIHYYDIEDIVGYCMNHWKDK